MAKKTQLILFFILQFAFTIYSQTKTVNVIDTAWFQTELQTFVKGNNQHRYRHVRNFAERDSLCNLSVKKEAIDWFGVYNNVIVEKKGQTDSVVYIVCHYDKIDGNVFALVNTLVNGNFDILTSNISFSKGAYDNGTGVLSALSLLPWINDVDLHYTYRFLFTGMEEYGLRGTRTHISNQRKKDWAKSFYAINIDMVGKDGITVTYNISDANLVQIADKISYQNNYHLTKAKLPQGALTDYYFFKGQNFFKDFGFSVLGNLTGGFIPQRSYFTGFKKGIPVINFTDNANLAFAELASMFSPVSFGEIHSFHDNTSIVNIHSLVEYNNFLKDYISFIDTQRSLLSDF